MADPNCLFCRIVAEEVPARFVHRDDLVVAFHDVNPQAPTHVLVLPVQHIASAADLTEADAPLLGRLFQVAAEVAREAGVAEAGYRIVANTGRDSGQTVDHVHFHVLGGRPFSWPPG